jgi:dTDP-4-amino-4,6-dideoxygalactose transaminase
MKRTVGDFALFGGKPAFARPLHVAQVNLPPWNEVEEAFRGIFERRYYANHGPLVRELEARFAEFAGVKHAICVANGTVALSILAATAGESGEVIVPAFTFPATAQAISWAGLTPVLCDVDRETHMLAPGLIEQHLSERTVGIMAVHLWGRPCRPESLEELAARRGVKLMFDACHAIGSHGGHRRIGGFGHGEAFSFHATKIVSGGEGGCITTNDDAVANELRTIRNFHPSETFAKVAKRMNGKMSEAQAALALLGLRRFDEYAAANRRRHADFQKELAGIPGVTLLEYPVDETNNYQYVVVEIDEARAGADRDAFLAVLAAENVLCRRHFEPGLHRMSPYSRSLPAGARFPVTELLCSRVLQLPNSQNMSTADVAGVCGLIRSIQERAGDVAAARRRSRS